MKIVIFIFITQKREVIAKNEQRQKHHSADPRKISVRQRHTKGDFNVIISNHRKRRRADPEKQIGEF